MSVTAAPLKRKARKRSYCPCGRLILYHDWIYLFDGESRWVCWLCAYTRTRKASAT